MASLTCLPGELSHDPHDPEEDEERENIPPAAPAPNRCPSDAEASAALPQSGTNTNTPAGARLDRDVKEKGPDPRPALCQSPPASPGFWLVDEVLPYLSSLDDTADLSTMATPAARLATPRYPREGMSALTPSFINMNLPGKNHRKCQTPGNARPRENMGHDAWTRYRDNGLPRDRSLNFWLQDESLPEVSMMDYTMDSPCSSPHVPRHMGGGVLGSDSAEKPSGRVSPVTPSGPCLPEMTGAVVLQRTLEADCPQADVTYESMIPDGVVLEALSQGSTSASKSHDPASPQLNTTQVMSVDVVQDDSSVSPLSGRGPFIVPPEETSVNANVTRELADFSGAMDDESLPQNKTQELNPACGGAVSLADSCSGVKLQDTFEIISSPAPSAPGCSQGNQSFSQGNQSGGEGNQSGGQDNQSFSQCNQTVSQGNQSSGQGNQSRGQGGDVVQDDSNVSPLSGKGTFIVPPEETSVNANVTRELADFSGAMDDESLPQNKTQELNPACGGAMSLADSCSGVKLQDTFEIISSPAPSAPGCSQGNQSFSQGNQSGGQDNQSFSQCNQTVSQGNQSSGPGNQSRGQGGDVVQDDSNVSPLSGKGTFIVPPEETLVNANVTRELADFSGPTGDESLPQNKTQELNPTSGGAVLLADNQSFSQGNQSAGEGNQTVSQGNQTVSQGNHTVSQGNQSGGGQGNQSGDGQGNQSGGGQGNKSGDGQGNQSFSQGSQSGGQGNQTVSQGNQSGGQGNQSGGQGNQSSGQSNCSTEDNRTFQAQASVAGPGNSTLVVAVDPPVPSEAHTTQECNRTAQADESSSAMIIPPQDASGLPCSATDASIAMETDCWDSKSDENSLGRRPEYTPISKSSPSAREHFENTFEGASSPKHSDPTHLDSLAAGPLITSTPMPDYKLYGAKNKNQNLEPQAKTPDEPFRILPQTSSTSDTSDPRHHAPPPAVRSLLPHLRPPHQVSHGVGHRSAAPTPTATAAKKRALPTAVAPSKSQPKNTGKPSGIPSGIPSSIPSSIPNPTSLRPARSGLKPPSSVANKPAPTEIPPANRRALPMLRPLARHATAATTTTTAASANDEPGVPSARARRSVCQTKRGPQPSSDAQTLAKKRRTDYPGPSTSTASSRLPVEPPRVGRSLRAPPPSPKASRTPAQARCPNCARKDAELIRLKNEIQTLKAKQRDNIRT